MIKFLKLIPFCLAAISANGRHIEHAISELYEGSSLYWDV